MKCSKVKMQLNYLIDNELDHENCAMIREHLLNCASCHIELANIERLKKHFVELSTPELSNAFEANLHQLTSHINNKNKYKKHLPIAASFLLAIPLISVLISDKNITTENLLVVEPSTVEETLLSYEDFIKWTQFENTNLYLKCDVQIKGGACSIEVKTL